MEGFEEVVPAGETTSRGAATSGAPAVAAAAKPATPEHGSAEEAEEEAAAREQNRLKQELWTEIHACEEQCAIAGQMMDILEQESLAKIPESLYDIMEFFDVIRPRLLKLSQEGSVGDLDEISFGKALELNDTVCALLKRFIEIERKVEAPPVRPRVIARKATPGPTSESERSANQAASASAAASLEQNTEVTAVDSTPAVQPTTTAGSASSMPPVTVIGDAKSPHDRTVSNAPAAVVISGSPPPYIPPPTYEEATESTAGVSSSAGSTNPTAGAHPADKPTDSESFSLDDL